MAKRKDIQQTSDNTTPGEQDPSVTPAQGAENSPTPSVELIKIQPPSAEPPKLELPPTPMPKVESPRLAPELKAETASAAPPPVRPQKPVPQPKAPEVVVAPAASARSGRFALLAASVAITAALGSAAGALGSTLLMRLLSAPATSAGPNEMRALHDTIAQLGSDLASVKANLDSTNRLNNTQFTRLSEKLDRAERAQAEPTTRIAKIAESVERLERRPVAAATPVPAASADVTGSVADPARAPVSASGLAVGKSAIVDGWVLRDIYRGRALVEGRSGILFEVGPGSTIPGIGRVETITRQDGRWIVVTPKGLIVSMR